MPRSFYLFLIIFIEGYVVLATELLAIRQTMPFVGSGTDTVAIIIAAVLMPLAAGYYMGGHYNPAYAPRLPGALRQTVRRKLMRNILIATAFLIPALSTVFVNIFFGALISSGYSNRILLACSYAGLFLVTPVYLLGQTVPLISHYFARGNLPHVTGKILFFSTMGSFIGATLSTLALMSFLGVSITVMITLGLLLITVVILEPRQQYRYLRPMAAMILVTIVINSPWLLRTMNIVAENQYNTVRVVTDHKGVRHFSLNNNRSSTLHPDGRASPYIEWIEDRFITPTLTRESAPKNILVIGAGGFTLGREDDYNHYIFVDIDPALLDLAESYFLPEKLGNNKIFRPQPARAFLTENSRKFDLILLDVYRGDTSLPEHLLTKEFFLSIRQALAPKAVMAANLIGSPLFQSRFSRNLDYTLRQAFPFISRQVIQVFDGWDERETNVKNIVYFYKHWSEPPVEASIYTDNKNRVFLDKPHNKPLKDDTSY